MSSPPKRSAGRFGEKMRSLRGDEIVRAASRALLCRGCGDFRVEEVAATCGVAKGTCYQHFGSRPALLDAAVRRLDEALAKHLLSPPPRLTKPHQMLEWALFEAVDAEIRTLERRDGLAEFKTEALEEMAWACCLGRMPCPHGGAARSTKALHHWTKGLASPNDGRASVCVTLLLALAPSHFFKPDRDTRPDTRTIRTGARWLFKQLFP